MQGRQRGIEEGKFSLSKHSISAVGLFEGVCLGRRGSKVRRRKRKRKRQREILLKVEDREEEEEEEEN